jgi:hypothetical protein
MAWGMVTHVRASDLQLLRYRRGWETWWETCKEEQVEATDCGPCPVEGAAEWGILV